MHENLFIDLHRNQYGVHCILILYNIYDDVLSMKGGLNIYKCNENIELDQDLNLKLL